MRIKNLELPGQTNQPPSRRRFLQRLAGTGLATVAGVALLPHASWARFRYLPYVDPQIDIDILNFALTLERLEAAFYNANGDKAYLGTGTLKSMIAEIRDHENAHVALLEGALGAKAGPKPTFQGLDAPTLTQFLTMSQTFEDVGVSAYLGQAPLINDKGYLATAAAIMDIEARHAGGIRSYRKTVPSNGNPPDGGDPNITLTEDREALNRVRTKAEVLTLVAPFIVGAATATNPGTM
jgi:hypothetical protein